MWNVSRGVCVFLNWRLWQAATGCACSCLDVSSSVAVGMARGEHLLMTLLSLWTLLFLIFGWVILTKKIESRKLKDSSWKKWKFVSREKPICGAQHMSRSLVSLNSKFWSELWKSIVLLVFLLGVERKICIFGGSSKNLAFVDEARWSENLDLLGKSENMVYRRG